MTVAGDGLAGRPLADSSRVARLTVRRQEMTRCCEQAEARAQALRVEKTHWYTAARGAQSRLAHNRRKLSAVRQTLKAVRSTAKEARSLKAEVARLKRLLEQASMEPGKRSTNGTLRLKCGQLKTELAQARALIDRLQQDLTHLREKDSTLTRTLFGRASEQRRRTRRPHRRSKVSEPDPLAEGQRRGQRPGGEGHGRTDRRALAQRIERLDPPEAQRQCSSCGKAYQRNGYVESRLMEVAFEAWQRVIRRGRWVPACDCPTPVDHTARARSPSALPCKVGRHEVIAAPVGRLFDKTPYGVSVGSWFLVEVYGYDRPANRTSAWLKAHGAPISAPTLSGSLGLMAPLFLPLYNALRQRLTASRLCQGDETRWRVQSLPGLGKAWLWVGLSSDCVVFRVDPTRSGQAALKLFGELQPGTIVVCDRYSAYPALVRRLGGGVRLALCWVHARRDRVRGGDAHATLRPWADGWLDRYAKLFHLNKKRLKHYRSGRPLERPSKAFGQAHQSLTRQLNVFFERAAKQLETVCVENPRRRPLAARVRDREGLCVFLEHPEVPMSNNTSEQVLRGPAIGRKLSFGSNSEHGAAFTAMMYSILTPLRWHPIDVRQWLIDWLGACAANGRRPPADLTPWLPWTMTPERRAPFALSPPPLDCS